MNARLQTALVRILHKAQAPATMVSAITSIGDTLTEEEAAEILEMYLPARPGAAADKQGKQVGV